MRKLSTFSSTFVDMKLGNTVDPAVRERGGMCCRAFLRKREMLVINFKSVLMVLKMNRTKQKEYSALIHRTCKWRSLLGYKIMNNYLLGNL